MVERKWGEYLAAAAAVRRRLPSGRRVAVGVTDGKSVL